MDFQQQRLMIVTVNPGTWKAIHINKEKQNAIVKFEKRARIYRNIAFDSCSYLKRCILLHIQLHTDMWQRSAQTKFDIFVGVIQTFYYNFGEYFIVFCNE